MHVNSDGSDGARSKHAALVRRKYRLLAPEDPLGNPAAANPQRS